MAQFKPRKCENCGKWTDISNLQNCNRCDGAYCNNCYIEKSELCVNCDEELLQNRKEVY